MESFSIIQQFFTRMTCNFCQHHFREDGIQLLQEGEGVCVVGVYCHACQRDVGVAMVGFGEQSGVGYGTPGMEIPIGAPQRQYPDPEFTEFDLERFEDAPAISANDVLEAHEFFSNLDSGWTRLIPEEIRERCIGSQTE